VIQMTTTSADATPTIGFRDGRVRAVWYLSLAIVLAVGGYAMWLRIRGGLASTNMSSVTPWGAYVAFYIYFVGLSAGAFLVSTLSNVFGVKGLHEVDRDALLAAIIAMVVAMLFVWSDLGRMDRMYHPFLWRQITSALSWEVHAYVAYIGVLVAELYFAMRIDLVRLSERVTGWRRSLYRGLALWRTDTDESARTTDRRWLRRFGILGIPLAIFFVHGGTGVLFAVAKARPYWNSGLFPVIFIVSAVLSGTALVMAIYVLRTWFLSDRDVDSRLLDRLGQLLAAFVLVDVALTAIDALIAIASLHPAELDTWLLIMTGPMAWSFWGVMVALGWVLPLALVSRRAWRRTPSLMLVAGISVVVGIVGVRFNIVVPPLVVPVFHELPWGAYFPTLVEWGSTAGMIAVGLLLFTIGAELLPLSPLGGEHE